MVQFENAVKRYRKIILDELTNANITCWLAGGSIRDYFMGVPIKTDYDIFFPNEEEYNKTNSYFKNNNGVIKWESENGCKIKYKDRTYDLVKKYFPDPESTINAFDFTVSMFAVDNKQIYFGESSFIDLAKRQLIINKITYPASTLSRAFRYYKKGFTMCLGEMKKIYESIQETPKIEKTDTVPDNTLDESISGDLNVFFTGID